MWKRHLVAMLLLLAAPLQLMAAEEPAEPKSPFATTHAVLDAAGKIHHLEPHSRSSVRVFVFLTAECPIARSYFPLLNRLAEQSQQEDQSLELYGIWADAFQTPAEIAAQVKEYDLQFPVLLDREGTLGKAFAPTHSPEAFVLDATGRVAYQGRIDNRYVTLDRRKPEATEHDLTDAIAAVADGKEVAVPRTKSMGCYYETLPEASGDEAEVTYTKDIAPILYANCVECHRDGEIGPFSLVSYTDAAKRARQIARVVESKLMPPWKASATHGEFEGQRTLSEKQIAKIKAWAEGDRAEGDPQQLPKLPEFPSGWPLGEPDLIVEMPAEFEVPADGPDIYQNFVIPLSIPEDKLVSTIDFRPGATSVVHHSLLYLDNSGAARRLDAKTPEPGYGTFGDPGFMPSGSIGGWSPGKAPRPLPEGIGRHLAKGSDLVMQNHYHPSGKVERDRSKVGIYFVDKPKKPAFAVWAASFAHDIAPGDNDYRLETSYTLPRDVTMLSVVPHMHLLGQEMKATAVLPDGTRKHLLHIPQWDFNWQDEYMFAEPFDLPQGTRLEVEARYDNSAGNPANPSSPPEQVYWGEQTNDEMLYCFFLVTAKSIDDLKVVIGDCMTREIVAKSAAKIRRQARK